MSAEAPPLREGWLTKVGGRVRSWKRRWFVLRPHALTYYKNEERARKGRSPLGVVPLAGAWVQLVPEARHGRRFCLGVQPAQSTRTYVMQAGDEAAMTAWADAVQEAVRALTRGAQPESEVHAGAKVVMASKRTLFGKTYATYLTRVEMGPLRWTVDKRFSEFVALHRKLAALCEAPGGPPAGSLPPVPARRLLGNLKDETLEERKVALNRYLEAVMARPDLRGSIPVMQFLGAMEDREGETKDVPHIQRRLYLDKVVQVAESGDVLLFRTQGVLQSVQRTFTSSFYDHAGVVIRSPPRARSVDSLMVLEATGEGVRLWPLYHRLRAWYLSDALVTLRRVERKRTPAELAELARFGDEMHDRKYGLNPVSILRRVSVADRDSFFCSEVVAMAMKRVGWLPPDPPANSYFPASFGEHAKEPLPLAGGVELSPEILILFKKPEVSRSRQSLSARPSLQVERRPRPRHDSRGRRSPRAAAGAAEAAAVAEASTDGTGGGDSSDEMAEAAEFEEDEEDDDEDLESLRGDADNSRLGRSGSQASLPSPPPPPVSEQAPAPHE